VRSALLLLPPPPLQPALRGAADGHTLVIDGGRWHC
jgi:hypothetical protein